MFVRIDDALSQELPQGESFGYIGILYEPYSGVIWSGAEGSTFSVETISQLLRPQMLSMGTDGFQASSVVCKVSISLLERFLSSSYMLEYIRKYIQLDSQNPQNKIKVFYNFRKIYVHIIISFNQIRRQGRMEIAQFSFLHNTLDTNCK